MARIVVGIDGSDHAKQALRWALDEARLRGASLRVVDAWHGGFAGLLLGSVSQQCAQHAPCPVVIVRAGEA